MEFWKEVRRQVLTNELSQRAACKKYSLGWHTLKKILAHDEPPGYRQAQPREKRKLAPFLPIIHEILTADRQAPKKQRHTAIRSHAGGCDRTGHLLHCGDGGLARDTAIGELGERVLSCNRRLRYLRSPTQLARH